MSEQSKIKTFFKGIGGILKNSLMIVVIQIMLSFFSMVMMADEPSSLILLLSFLSGASFFAILFFIGKSSAYSDFQIYKNNLIRQKHGDKVSWDRIIAQYRWFNGFVSALIPSAVFLILAIAGILQSPMVPDSNALGKIAFFANLVTLVPMINAGAQANLYLVIVSGALIVAAYGAGYLMHGIKLNAQYEELTKLSWRDN